MAACGSPIAPIGISVAGVAALYKVSGLRRCSATSTRDNAPSWCLLVRSGRTYCTSSCPRNHSHLNRDLHDGCAGAAPDSTPRSRPPIGQGTLARRLRLRAGRGCPACSRRARSRPGGPRSRLTAAAGGSQPVPYVLSGNESTLGSLISFRNFLQALQANHPRLGSTSPIRAN